MSIQQDPDGRRSVRVECEVPGTPEQVWQAIATGPGISAWFVPTKVDGRTGGEVVSDFGGGMLATAKITEWAAPNRFVADAPGWAPGMPPVATEWTVEAAGGGTCKVRVVHSMFASTDDWDNQLEGTETGWASFFRVLRRYLQHFAGQPSVLVQATAMAPQPIDAAWPMLTAAMGGAAETGRRLQMAIAPGVQLTGRVASVDDLGNGFNVQLELDRPAPGTLVAGVYACGGTMVQLSAFFYGANVAGIAAPVRQHLEPWLAGVFPAAAAEGG